MDNLRRFVLTISVVVFLTICAGGFYMSLHYNPVENSDKQPATPVPLDPAGNAYNNSEHTLRSMFKGNVLYILSSSRDQTATAFAVSRYNPATSDLEYLIIPSELMVSDSNDSSKVKTLGDYFVKNGGYATAQYLTSFLGTGINSYTMLTYQQIVAMVDELGSITVDLPLSISTHSRSYQQGSVQLSGTDLVELFLYAADLSSPISGDAAGRYGTSDLNTIHTLLKEDIIYCALRGITAKLAAEDPGIVTNCIKMLQSSFDTNLTDNEINGMSHNVNNISTAAVGYYRITGHASTNTSHYLISDGRVLNQISGEDLALPAVMTGVFYG